MPILQAVDRVVGDRNILDNLGVFVVSDNSNGIGHGPCNGIKRQRRLAVFAPGQSQMWRRVGLLRLGERRSGTDAKRRPSCQNDRENTCLVY